jgi:DNA-binding IclR family transcriptional regulator
MSEEHRYSVRVLEKAIKIFDIFTYGDSAFTLVEISKRTGLPKTTTFRILKTLENAGFLKYDHVREQYRLGLRFLELGGIVYESLSIRKAAAPFMDALSHSLRATILLGIIKDDQLLYIDKRESESIIRVSSHTGLKRPPYFGMLGMTLLAYLGEPEKKRLLKVYPPTKITDQTITNVRLIMRKLAETKRLGYYIERDEIVEGLVGVGVPIRDFSGNVVAALGATQPAFQIKDGTIESTVRQLVQASQSISKELGYT